ncbi:piggyBac transposable element-derived protein 4-like [Nilaparvata lugens]|uniref:piggyBac transposable element-derived protein 4-like n=1 Tax=Nilaparvata lugens TaxID=108931 RepID=UPI00193CC571|nr:piggyBac transposable element-derived protein 4-like [Nilaparvata lugens]
MTSNDNLNDNEIREFFMDSGSEDESESEFDSNFMDDSQPGPSGMNSSNLQRLDHSSLQDSGTDSDNSIVMDVDSEDSESDEEVFIGPQNLYDWVDATDTSKFVPHLFDFDDTNSGIDHNLGLSADSTESDCFKVLFDSDLVTHIVEETNRYCEQYKSSTVLKKKSKLHKWYDTVLEEIYTFLAIIMLMPHNKKNKIMDYWSTDPLLHTPIFGKIFSQDRFMSLLRMLHFVNNEDRVQGDRLGKITTIFHSLRMKFKNVFTPFKNVCIDESMLQWKGRLSFKQFMPQKRHRFGIKIFILCDCNTGFINDMVVYTGKQTTIDIIDSLGISGSVVTTLLEPHLGLGHTVYVDNWYTSPHLFQYLYTNKTGAVGTVRSNRKDLSKFPKMKSGEYTAKKTTCLLAEKWVDRKEVHMLSSVHTNELRETGKVHYRTKLPIIKPASVIDYNKNMGLIDKSDMQISFTDSARKSAKWYKKFFFHLLDVVVYNAFIMHRMVTGKNMELGQFRLNLIRQLLEEFTPQRASRAGGRKSKHQDSPLRLKARHFPDMIPSTASVLKPRRACRVCKTTTLQPQKRQDTHWLCKECGDVPLCMPECFRAYHSLRNY